MILAIIQARLGSTRFPGKVLKPLNGRPMLEYQLLRLSRSREIDQTVIATTENRADDAIADFCLARAVECFRGSENDVLDRFYQCARSSAPSWVVRLTGDCPLIDPQIVDQVIRQAREHPEIDLVRTGDRYPEGVDVEVISFLALETAWREAGKKSEREHVTSFLWSRPERFRVRDHQPEEDWSNRIRFTVDEQIDYSVVVEIARILEAPHGIHFTFEDICRLHEQRPELFRRNRHLPRNEGYEKSVQEDELNP